MKYLLVITTALFMSVQLQAADLSTKQIVEQANQQWNAAFNQGNVEQISALYTDDATLSPGNGAVLKGRTEIEQLFASFIQNGVHNHQIEIVEVIATDGQVTQLAHWQADGVNADNQAVTFGGVLMSVLQQNEAGEWQLQSHVWNAAP